MHSAQDMAEILGVSQNTIAELTQAGILTTDTYDDAGLPAYSNRQLARLRPPIAPDAPAIGDDDFQE